jgi:hypothetical protein
MAEYIAKGDNHSHRLIKVRNKIEHQQKVQDREISDTRG